MVLESVFPPDIRVEKEVRTLTHAGHNVFVLSVYKDGMSVEENIDDMTVLRRRLPHSILRRVYGLVYLSLSGIDPFWQTHVVDAVLKYNIDVVHVHDLPLVNTGLKVARRYGIPLVADLHENYPETAQFYDTTWKGKMLNLLISQERWKGFEKSWLNRVDRVVTVIDEAKRHYINDCGIPVEKVTVVMNVEDLDYFYSIPIKEDIVKRYEPYFTISYIGGFGSRRGIQTAILALPQILSKIPHARLLLVGTGDNALELRELAHKRGLDSVVEFTGWQPFDLVPSYFAASKVCLIPHIASEHTDTTIAWKISQAMAMGKPVVVSSAKPLERIVNETGAGLVYPSGDADALAKALIAIHHDRDLAFKLGEAGKRAAETRFNWKVEGEKLTTLYAELEK